MNPNVRRDLPLLRQLDHVNRRRISPRRLKFSDRRGSRPMTDPPLIEFKDGQSFEPVPS
jgi:hypothetical protein